MLYTMVMLGDTFWGLLWEYILAPALIIIGIICVLVMLFSKSDKKNEQEDGAKTIEITIEDKTRNKNMFRSEDNSDDNKVNKKEKDFGNSMDNELVRLLLSFDDARLMEIINCPLLYNEDCIKTAGAILARRKAWVNINNLSDRHLIRMVTTDKHLYDESTRGAASMELYQRDSQLLYDEIHKMSWATIKSIANGTLAVPEGIRLAAQKYLNKKSN